MRLLFAPRLLLPLIIFAGVLVMGMRVNDLWDAASSGALFSNARAETKSDAPADAPAGDAAKTAEASKPDAPPSDDSDVSPAEMEILKQLSSRREELDKRAKDLDARQALIKVAETRVDQKIKEMETLRLQLQTMLGQVSENQAVQLENLVKIYETMKPKEAAKIFETLDMPVLLNVVQRMKPARTALVMAEMAPEKAKEVTVALTKQDKLPQVK